MRAEYILVGCLLVLVGITLCVIGYNKTQPSALEQAAQVLKELSGEANIETGPSNVTGYLLLIGGGIAFIAGIVFILKSRQMSPTQSSSKGTSW
jgi:hypothetical protein